MTQHGQPMISREGSCHCGNVGITFRSRTPTKDMRVTACQCAFCRKHGAAAISDTEGEAEIRIADESLLERYRFGHRSADFLVCRRCGVYIGAYMDGADGAFAVLSVRTLNDQAEFSQAPVPVDFEAEAGDPQMRLDRRRARWTPTSLLIGDGART